MLIICEVLAIVRIWKAGGEGVIDVIDEVVNSNVILIYSKCPIQWFIDMWKGGKTVMVPQWAQGRG